MSRLKAGSAAVAIVATLVGGFEGVKTYAYRDPVGIPTICFGETKNVHIGDTATMTQCKTMLGDRLIEFSAGVDKCLVATVSDKTYAAFVSFAYNVGVGAFCGSTLVHLANGHQTVAACNELPKWNKAHGIVLPGLVKRRAAERALCLEGAAA